jgi:uncharacterized protein (DUF58 family)
MGEPHVRQYMEDREITAWLLLDLSGSIDFGTALVRKRDLVSDFAAVIARLLTRHGNRVGALLFSGQVDEVVPAKGGQLQALRLIHQLARPDRRSTPGATNLGEVLEQAAKTLRRRSLVFVVSDFISAAGWEQSLSRLARRNEVVAVWVRDPREEEIPDIGPVVLEDAETGEQLYVETQDRKFRDRFRALVEERRRHIERTFARHGIDVLALTTEGDLVRDLGRFALLRRQSRQRQGAGYARAAAGATT